MRAAMTVLYLAASLAGIAFVVGLNVVLFGRAVPGLGNDAAIAEQLAREIPGFRAGSCAMAADGRSALVENTANHAILLVHAVGDGIVVRKLSRDLLAAVARERSRLSLRLADFTFPEADLALADESLAAEWEARLKV